MSDGKKYYCFCSSNCKYETMTKEQILAAITQAVETGSVGDVDTGFITAIKEKNSGRAVTFWVGTQVQYNAIETKDTNCMYIITDDTLRDDMLKALETATQAASDATEASSNAAAAAAEMTSVDISNKITLNIGTIQDGCTASVKVQKCIYNKALGVVFFVYLLKYNGTMAKGANITFTQAGGYAPRTGAQYGILETYGDFSAYYMHSGISGETSLQLAARAAIQETQYGYTTQLTGWYFCDGEG